MKKLLILAAFLGSVVGLCALIGSMLPRDHVAIMTVTVAAPQVKVWTTITSPTDYPSWRKNVKSVEIISQGPLSWKETSSMGPMTLVATVVQAPSKLPRRTRAPGRP